MGCSYDHFSAVVSDEAAAKKFVEIFMDALKSDLDCTSACCVRKTDDGKYRIVADEYPLFNEMRQGAQLHKFVFAYLKAVPDEPFHAAYTGTYDDCGAKDSTDYSYHDGRLDIVETHSEGESEGFCVYCGFSWNPYEEELDVCPECGEELDADKQVWTYHYQLIDGEFSKIKE